MSLAGWGFGPSLAQLGTSGKGKERKANKSEELMEIVGLSGYARSGKDSAADILVEEFGYIRVAFADKLREVLYQLNPIVQFSRPLGFIGDKNPYEYVFIQDVIDQHGWDGYKTTSYGPEIRRLIQRLGTEAGRGVLGDSLWIDAAFAGLPSDAHVVVTDCRFENEARAVKERGGSMWRVTRDGVGPANDHPSETSLDDWNFDVYLANDGTLEAWQQKLRWMGGIASFVKT